MRKGLVAILFLVCGVLLAGNVVAYVGEDHSDRRFPFRRKLSLMWRERIPPCC